MDLSFATRILLSELEHVEKAYSSEEESPRSDVNNVVVSPLSLTAILSILAAGSTGRTLEQILGFLKLKDLDEVIANFSRIMAMAFSPNGDDTEDNKKRSDLGVDLLGKRKVGDGELNTNTISMANGVWVNQLNPLKPSYQALVKDVFMSTAKTFDVNKVDEMVKEANSWAKRATKGLITDILKPNDITRDTVLLLGNALYFRGVWRHKFHQHRTKERSFYLLNGVEILAPFMTSDRGNRYPYGSFDDFKVLQIPYQEDDDGSNGNKFSMYLFLPHKRDGVHDLLTKAGSDYLSFLEDHLQKLKETKLDNFWIPKFKCDYSVDARSSLQEMGLCLPFDGNCRELTAMVETKEPIFVSNMTQKGFIEVDEEGTTAAAITTAKIRKMMAVVREPKIFVADHPFLFIVIEETSQLLLFAGVVLNPLSN